MSDADKALFTSVAREAAARASEETRQREASLIDEFRSKGLLIQEMDVASFRAAVARSVSVESLGYEQRDYDRIIALH